MCGELFAGDAEPGNAEVTMAPLKAKDGGVVFCNVFEKPKIKLLPTISNALAAFNV
jgi:hypothetical protein